MGFAVSILDKNFQVFDYQNYFEIELFLYKKKSNSVNNKNFEEELIYLNLTNCSNKKDLYTDSKLNTKSFQDEFEINNLKNAKCLENNYYTTLTEPNVNLLFLEGEVTNQNYSNLNYNLKKCNKTKNSLCKSNKDINDVLKDSHFAIYFIDKSINPFSFNSPFNYYLYAYFTKLDNNLFKKVDFYFQNSTISTDEGIMFQEYRDQTYFTFNYLNEQTYSANSDILFELTLNSSRNSEFYKRYYMKLQDLAAMIGGIVNVCMVLGELISRFFNRHIMYVVILNNLFNFKIKSDELNIIRSNLNMNDILDKQNDEQKSEPSKHTELQMSKAFKRRRSPIFMNTKLNLNLNNISDDNNINFDKKTHNKSHYQIQMLDSSIILTSKMLIHEIINFFQIIKFQT